MLTEISTHVPAKALVDLATQTEQEGHVRDVTTKTRCEAARDSFLEAEAVGVSLYLSESSSIGDVAVHRNDWAVTAAIRREVTDQQGLAAVTTVNRAAVSGVTEEEATIDLFAVVIGVAIKLKGVAQVKAEVGPELHVVIDDRTTPDHRGYRYALVAVVDQALCVSTLFRTTGRVRLAPLSSQVQEA